MAESDHRAHRSRQLYQKVNGMKKGYKGHESFIRNKDGELLTTKMEIKERWTNILNTCLMEKTLKKSLIV